MQSQAHAASGPLAIDTVPTPGGAWLGMSHCPGRRGADAAGRLWQRDLGQDLAAIEAWGGTLVLSLIEADEFARLGVADFAAAIGRSALQWLHLPVTDMRTPGPSTRLAWRRHGPVLLAALQRRERVLVHCAAGLGRTGMLVAKLLVLQGVPADAAIATVRAARPGTIETEAQAQWVRSGTLD